MNPRVAAVTKAQEGSRYDSTSADTITAQPVEVPGIVGSADLLQTGALYDWEN